eukprot:PhM_4_TR13619/c0_g1_i1/m.9477
MSVSFVFCFYDASSFRQPFFCVDQKDFDEQHCKYIMDTMRILSLLCLIIYITNIIPPTAEASDIPSFVEAQVYSSFLLKETTFSDKTALLLGIPRTRLLVYHRRDDTTTFISFLRIRVTADETLPSSTVARRWLRRSQDTDFKDIGTISIAIVNTEFPQSNLTLDENDDSNKSWQLIGIISGATVCFVVVVFLLRWWYLQKRISAVNAAANNDMIIENSFSSSSHQIKSLSMPMLSPISNATNNKSKKNEENAGDDDDDDAFHNKVTLLWQKQLERVTEELQVAEEKNRELTEMVQLRFQPANKETATTPSEDESSDDSGRDRFGSPSSRHRGFKVIVDDDDNEDDDNVKKENIKRSDLDYVSSIEDDLLALYGNRSVLAVDLQPQQQQPSSLSTKVKKVENSVDTSKPIASAVEVVPAALMLSPIMNQQHTIKTIEGTIFPTFDEVDSTTNRTNTAKESKKVAVVQLPPPRPPVVPPPLSKRPPTSHHTTTTKPPREVRKALKSMRNRV